jgi:hypothetical protein
VFYLISCFVHRHTKFLTNVASKSNNCPSNKSD